MSYIPINNLNLNFTQIGIPAQSYSASSTVLTLSGNTNSSVVTLSGNNIILPRFRSYFIWGNVPFQGSSASDNPGIGLYNTNTSTLELLGSQAYQYYFGGVTEVHYTGDIMNMLISTGVDYTMQIKDIGGLASTVTIYNNNSLRSDSNITILYTDESIGSVNLPSALLVSLAGISQLTASSLNKYHQYTLNNSGYRYFPPTTPSVGDIIGFIHISGTGSFAVEYPANSGTYLTGGFINSASTRKSFIFRWNGTTWVDIGQITII